MRACYFCNKTENKIRLITIKKAEVVSLLCSKSNYIFNKIKKTPNERSIELNDTVCIRCYNIPYNLSFLIKKRSQSVNENGQITPDDSYSWNNQPSGDGNVVQDSSNGECVETVSNEELNDNFSQNVGSASSVVSSLFDSSYQSTQSTSFNTTQPIIPKIQLNIDKSYSSHKGCAICKKIMNVKNTVIPAKAIEYVFLQKSIIIPKGSRCCFSHLNEYDLIDELSMDQITPISDRIILNS